MVDDIREFVMPAGRAANPNCGTCYSRGYTGFDIVRNVWLLCACVERIKED